jgi:hypothetical protein
VIHHWKTSQHDPVVTLLLSESQCTPTSTPILLEDLNKVASTLIQTVPSGCGVHIASELVDLHLWLDAGFRRCDSIMCTYVLICSARALRCFVNSPFLVPFLCSQRNPKATASTVKSAADDLDRKSSIQALGLIKFFLPSLLANTFFSSSQTSLANRQKSNVCAASLNLQQKTHAGHARILRRTSCSPDGRQWWAKYHSVIFIFPGATIPQTSSKASSPLPYWMGAPDEAHSWRNKLTRPGQVECRPHNINTKLSVRPRREIGSSLSANGYSQNLSCYVFFKNGPNKVSIPCTTIFFNKKINGRCLRERWQRKL